MESELDAATLTTIAGAALGIITVASVSLIWLIERGEHPRIKVLNSLICVKDMNDEVLPEGIGEQWYVWLSLFITPLKLTETILPIGKLKLAVSAPDIKFSTEDWFMVFSQAQDSSVCEISDGQIVIHKPCRIDMNATTTNTFSTDWQARKQGLQTGPITVTLLGQEALMGKPVEVTVTCNAAEPAIDELARWGAPELRDSASTAKCPPQIPNFDPKLFIKTHSH
jgi:hypothetical protein